MKNLAAISLLLALIPTIIYAQETCGVIFPKTCQEDECCLLPFLGVCRPLRQNNQPCGFLACPCAPGLECMRRGRGRYICSAAITSTSTTSSTSTSSTSTTSSTTASTPSTTATSSSISSLSSTTPTTLSSDDTSTATTDAPSATTDP